jgi:hypothetical protein
MGYLLVQIGYGQRARNEAQLNGSQPAAVSVEVDDAELAFASEEGSPSLGYSEPIMWSGMVSIHVLVHGSQQAKPQNPKFIGAVCWNFLFSSSDR